MVTLISLICWLLILPRLDLAGFISLHFGLLGKFGLWSLRVINAWLLGYCSTLSVNLNFSAIYLVSMLICKIVAVSVFL